MLQYIQRMEMEKIDLEGKIKRCKNAVLKSKELRLDKKQEAFLQQQLAVMTEYHSILCTRIIYEKQLHGE